MKIQAVKFHQNGFMTEPFAFGGEDGMEAFEDLPEDWKCPRCKQPKTKFNAA